MPILKIFCPEPSAVKLFITKYVEDHKRLPPVFISKNDLLRNFSLNFIIRYESDSSYLLQQEEVDKLHNKTLMREITQIHQFGFDTISSQNLNFLQDTLKKGFIDYYGFVCGNLEGGIAEFRCKCIFTPR